MTEPEPTNGLRQKSTVNGAAAAADTMFVLAKSSQVVHTVEMHTGGEPARLITSGMPPIQGKTLLEKRRFCRQHLDHYRMRLMAEPRGHGDMYGAVLVEPDDAAADAAVLFIHTEGYGTMCGHASMALTRYLVDAGVVARAAGGADTEVALQCPCGLVKSVLTADNTSRFRSVPSFQLPELTDLKLPLPGDGGVCRYDISYGGAFYAILRAEECGLTRKSTPGEYRALAEHVSKHVNSSAGVTCRHPDPASPDLGYLSGVTFCHMSAALSDTAAPPPDSILQVVVFADGQIDRSPCGSGSTATCAMLHAVGRLPLQQECRFRSIVGSEFTGRVLEEHDYHGEKAVVVEVGGKAFYTGTSQFIVEEEDPEKGGFLVR